MLMLLAVGVVSSGVSARAQIIPTFSPLGMLYSGPNMDHSFNTED
ncbi:hypothetical protein PsAD13_05196 [Pseudovibrio sp. Ad13]|nr:hypothetical protein PsAD13_05196 [Pseudovibrio sp. Ad13]